MNSYEARFQVPFTFPVHFTRDVFSERHPLLRELTSSNAEPVRILAVFDRALTEAVPELADKAIATCSKFAEVFHVKVSEGGEQVKNDFRLIEELHVAVDEARLSRHSYIFAVGGGALLDAAGFAAATAHRGVRLIRFPTTTLSQADAGVGVKNAINFRNKKNFVGTFAPPFAVVNDFDMLEPLPERDAKSGMIEAVKVAAIKDRDFFYWIQKSADQLRNLDRPCLHLLIERCARMHLDHICTGGDPFELGSSRPLDFGHWAAHKLEQISDFRLRHGEAVAIGVALDTLYSAETGLCTAEEARTVLSLIQYLGFETNVPELGEVDELLKGIEEFREHLGGRLTVTMLTGIGESLNVHSIDTELMKCCVARLRT